MDVQFDPTDHYDEPARNMLEACGFIPYFIAEAEESVCEEDTAEDVMRLLMDIYGFPTDVRMEGELVDEGVYRYPEDPDLYPYACFTVCGFDVYVYPYGIVAVQGPTDNSIARMD